MIDGFFVLDAVTHAYNHLPENWEDPVLGHAMVELAYHLAASPPDPKYAMTREQYLVDWQIPDVANLLFRESDTDVAVMHPLAISSFKDGYSSVAKAAEALETYPTRFIGAYACVDPLRGQGAIDAITQQVDMLKPLGLKLYPTSWDGTGPVSWRMDDPKLIYPLYEHAQKMGLKHVAVHKAVPIGPFPVGDAYNPSDIENAAGDFPDLTFEIVHGGLAFMEETAWLLARFGNIAINMEIQNIIVERRPRAFAEILLGLCRIGGIEMLERMFWGSGGTLHHPQPGLEAFASFEFPQDLLDNAGLFKSLRQITRDDKAGILSGNFARMHGLDLNAYKKGIEKDVFASDATGVHPRPYSTLSFIDQPETDTIYA
ncbi:amidohydrolase family protein [Novosphingobium sp.]|uniref:amidohydrolase family protein n=1 Tax=Novosphingobium sp. TaxID=1874826 RepID=UPI002633C5D2|nr:amidohydrolase family protein [Novosphingobium sp.]